MRKKPRFFGVILLTLALSSFSFSQFRKEGSSQGMVIKPGIGFETFSRIITWDEKSNESKLNSTFFTLSAEFEMQYGFSFTAYLGYAFSTYDAMIFRELPISIELDIGRIQGFILGGEIEKNLFSFQDFEIGAQGRFTYYLGKREEWSIPGLAVEGTVEGKPTWMRGTVGPVLAYRGFDSLYPYLKISYNKFWGTFKMDQTIQDLTGSEKKKIDGKDSFSFSLGASYFLTNAINIQGEVNILTNMDLGVMIKLSYSL